MTKQKKKIKTIGVFTSGGDAPGMNACIRAVTRAAIYYGIKVVGIERGYAGILEEQFRTFALGDVANIIQRGGTILKTSRCPEFHDKKVRKQAAEILRAQGIDALVPIGGDGTLTGAHKLWLEHRIPLVCTPGTIDNDLYGTEVTIGFDTAINTGLHAIDRIRDTASSHDRIFLIEVMGRNSGYIAVDVGLGGGAEAIVTPENPLSTAAIARSIARGEKRGKKSSIIVVAEGKTPDKTMKIAEELRKKHKLDSRVVILGHIQRGGSPTARDRKVASALGAYAVQELMAGQTDVMAGVQCGKATLTTLTDAVGKKKKLEEDLFELSNVLAT